MKKNTLNNVIANTDIYLVDQINKGRYCSQEIILDAGCGNGRNLHWFYQNHFTIYAIDKKEEEIANLKQQYFNQSIHFNIATLDCLPFENNFFHHVFCIAVLHFAKDKTHFNVMFSELLRVLKPKGSLFIRVASTIGIEDKIIPISEGVYKLPDGTTRFLLTKTLFLELQNEYSFKLLEPFKTVNVDDLRCMTTLVLQKQ